MLPGGRFQLRRTAVGQPRPVDDLGLYRLEGRELSLLGSRDEAVQLRLNQDGSLQALSDSRTGWQGLSAPRLQRLPQAAPIEPRLRLSGWFSTLADAPSMLLCADGRRLPVAMAGDFVALERAYGEQRPVPAAPVWAEVHGRVALRPAMEPGQPPQPTLVVERFLRLDPQARCTGPQANRRLTGTEWRLAWLGQQAAVFGEPSRSPGLRLDAGRVTGSDGCNRFMAQASLAGEALRFGPLAGTRMACPNESAQAGAFTEALGRVRGYEIRGDELSLLDDQGVTLLRLRAGR